MLAELVKAVLLGFVEGITEFLPVSSTGHLLVASKFLGLSGGKGFQDSFSLAIQLGAVFAVLLFYGRESFERRKLPLLLVSFLPAGILGFFLRDAIKNLLFSPAVVGVSLVLGGLVLLFLGNPKRRGRKAIGFPEALKIGLFQALALVPGVSRSGATIAGGLLLGLEKKDAVKYSFLLSIPALGVATGYELISGISSGVFSAGNFPVLLAGLFSSFVFSLLSIKWLLGFVERRGLAPFGWYRIFAGALVLTLVFLGKL